MYERKVHRNKHVCTQHSNYKLQYRHGDANHPTDHKLKLKKKETKFLRTKKPNCKRRTKIEMKEILRRRCRGRRWRM